MKDEELIMLTMGLPLYILEKVSNSCRFPVDEEKLRLFFQFLKFHKAKTKKVKGIHRRDGWILQIN